MDNTEQKRLILKILKQIKRGSTTQIAYQAFHHTNIKPTKSLLEELEKEKKVICEQETNACYWKLK